MINVLAPLIIIIFTKLLNLAVPLKRLKYFESYVTGRNPVTNVDQRKSRS